MSEANPGHQTLDVRAAMTNGPPYSGGLASDSHIVSPKRSDLLSMVEGQNPDIASLIRATLTDWAISTMQTFKARGHQGSWFARIGDEDIPCAWLQWRTGNHYFDPGAKAGEGKWVKYIDAIERGKKVALTGKRDEDGKWRRDGYIGLFEVANVAVTDQGLEFDFVQRLAHLK